MSLKRKTDDDLASASASTAAPGGFGGLLKRLRETGEFTPLVSDSKTLPGLESSDQPAIKTKPEAEAEPYTGVPSAEIERVWRLAIDLPWEFRPIKLKEILKTELGDGPLLAIWIATKYLRPEFERSPSEMAYELRRQQAKPQLYNAGHSLYFQRHLAELQEKKTRLQQETDSQRLERLFVNAVRRVFPEMIDEEQQLASLEISFQNGQPGYNITPDILFPKPTMFFGKMCRWLDYKNALGFKCSPKSYLREHNQAKNYSEVFGAGMLVYKHGFEQDLHQLEGVTCAREREVLEWLEKKRLNAAND